MGDFFRALGPALLQRCPRCRRGPVWRRFLSMNPDCPVCGLHFEREPGYFTGAMYVSYTLGILATAPLYFVLLYMGVDGITILALTVLVVVTLFPIFFRYSRVFWMYLDHGFNPVERAPQPEPIRPPEAGPNRTPRR